MKFLRVAKIYDDAKLPTRKNLTDAGMDFYAYRSATVPAHSSRVIHTGVSVEIPDGYMLLLKPKGRNNHLIGAGVVDAHYQPGEILIKYFNTYGHIVTILEGDAIGQGVLVPIVTPELVEVNIEEFKNSGHKRSDSGGIKTATFVSSLEKGQNFDTTLNE